MTAKTLNLAGSILQALNSTGGSAPEGIMYAGVMGRVTLGEFQQAIGLLRRAGLVLVDDTHQVRLTDEGRETALECDAAEAEAVR